MRYHHLDYYQYSSHSIFPTTFVNLLSIKKQESTLKNTQRMRRTAIRDTFLLLYLCRSNVPGRLLSGGGHSDSDDPEFFFTKLLNWPLDVSGSI